MSPCRGSQWSLPILAAGILFVGPVGILAQTTDAVCLSSFNWMDNSKGQSPCLVGAYLKATCNGGEWNVQALPPDYYYTGPSVNQQNPCQCSSVTYNAMSACGLCQNRTIIAWSSWNFNCSTIYPGVFPLGIPDGTAVPQWAFQDVTTSNMFNVTSAQAVGDNPESTASNAKSTGSSVATSTSGPNPVPAFSSSKSNTGTIIGGVVGGVVGAALIAGIVIFFVLRKKRSRIPPAAQFVASQTSPPSAIYTDTTSFGPQMVQPKLYDPSDPSTFPASPPPIYSTSSLRPGRNYNDVPQK